MILTAPTHPPASHEAQRHAYNAAFEELGLGWHWDSATWAEVALQGPHGVRRYLESRHPHLLRAYDADFLVQAIEAARARCQAEVTRIPVPAPPLPCQPARRLQRSA